MAESYWHDRVCQTQLQHSTLTQQFALFRGASLVRVLLLLLLRLADCATPPVVAYAGTSGALYRALATSDVRTVYLTGSVKLDRHDWTVAVNISRNVTVAAPPQYQAIDSYVTLDCANIAAGVHVMPGAQITFSWLEMVNYVEEMGQVMLLVGASPGGLVAFHHVVQRRVAGLGGKQTLKELMQLPRLEGSGDNHTAYFLPRFCFNSSREGSPHCYDNLVYIVDVATRLGPANSAYFANGVPLGEYDMWMESTVQISDVPVGDDCIPDGGASLAECVVRQLRLLAIQPVLIKAKPSASNLVKIVASLAILAVAVVLFLYFRRHYKTYQERRARRMRRIKEALGMGREAHGIMFNGLDGEVPDWQIMPMPVGYAPDEDGTVELHQDSNIRNLIKDMSNRPNRQIPDCATAAGVEYEVRIEMANSAATGAAGTTGTGMGVVVEDNCPIAAEVGLRRTPVVLLASGGGLASGSAATVAAEPGYADSAAQSPAGGAPPDRGRGGAAAGKLSGSGEPPAAAAAVGKGSEGARSGGTADAAALAVHSIRPSGGSGTTGASHRSVSATSTSRTALTEMAIGLGLSPPTAAAAAAMLATGGQSSSSGGGRIASQGLELHGSMAVTKAGLDVLLASRAARRRSGGTGTGSVGTTDAQAGSRSAGSKDHQLQLQQQQQQHPHRVQRQQQQQHEQQGMVAAAPAAGSGGQLVDSGEAAGGGGAAAARHAVTDVATRVSRSKDSDDDATQEDARPTEGTRVASLMDELEELRRDIMAGINDTQLQIMSVVGSGAFGTVYRGQWQGLEVAVKTVVFSASSENRKRALQEAALCQSINHRNIVATYAVDVQPLGAVNTPVLLSAGNGRNNATLSNLLDWRLYIVQEFCDGGPLRKLVQSRYLQTHIGPNMLVICELALELAQALAHLHSKNIIHGDLNPNNVLLKRDATSPIGFRVKMADFGLSVMVPLQKTHMSNLRLGTLYYIAPETCFRGQLGYAADVFSLGVMLWELYHGRLAGTRTPTGEPRYQPDFPDFPAACPVEYRKLAHRCLQKQPHNRLHSSQVVQRLHEMLNIFRAAIAAAPATAPPPLPPLPLGGPDEKALSPAAAPPTFAHNALAAASTAATPASGTPTPTESRHKPTSPTAAVAAATAAGGPEISPWQAATDSPRVSARPNGERR